MFRFTIRDLLWLMVVVALALALGIEHRRFAAARPWKTRAGALEQLFIDQGYSVEWNPAGSLNLESELVAIKKQNQILGGARTDIFAPSVP